MTQPNIYLFGNTRTKEPITGYKVISKYAQNCGAKNPKAITCTRLRKHLATLTQVLNLSENDLEQLATFMGHTLGIHRSSYRLPDDVYQTAKISKLLLLLEEGNTGKFKGQTLDEIDLDMNQDLMENVNVTDEDEIEEIHSPKDDEIENTEENNLFGEKHATVNDVSMNPKKGKKRILTKWTEEQKSVASNFFKNHIKSKKPPKKFECENLIGKYSNLFVNKDWLKIKVFIQNVYSKKIIKNKH